MQNQYRIETENKILDKINSICDRLPKIVTRFDRSIQQYTEVKTRFQKYDRGSVTVGTDETLMMSKYRYQDFVTAYMNYLRWKEGAV